MKMMTTMYALNKGGSYYRFQMMVEAFLERGWEVHCLSLTSIPIKDSYFCNHVVPLPFLRGNSLMAKFTLLTILPIWASWIGWKNQIDLIVAFGSLYAYVHAVPKKILKKPMVTMIRGDSSFGLKMRGLAGPYLWLNKLIEAVGLRFSDRIIAVNETLRRKIMNDLPKSSQKEVYVLYNNITPISRMGRENIGQIRQAYNIPKDAKVLVTAGILNRGKNIETLIRSLPKVCIENVYLIIAGEGSTRFDMSYKSFLKRLVSALDLEGRVIFTGWVSKANLCKILQACELFILPSLSEGMPNALLDALGCGLPCLGSDIPGVKEVLRYEELLFDPLSKEVLAKKINEFFSNERYSRSVLHLCSERARIFSFDWKERLMGLCVQPPYGIA